jgi:acyl-CoA synthetase (AMP-forming)/AMP-acid ligase II
MATISAGDALARLATDHPHMEIVRYEHKNVKWTLKHVNYYSDALACGFLDAGLQPGDVVLSWLPEHFAEQVSQSLVSQRIFSLVDVSMPAFVRLDCDGNAMSTATTSNITILMFLFKSIFFNLHAPKPVYSFTPSIPTLNLSRKILTQPKLLSPRPSS